MTNQDNWRDVTVPLHADNPDPDVRTRGPAVGTVGDETSEHAFPPYDDDLEDRDALGYDEDEDEDEDGIGAFLLANWPWFALAAVLFAGVFVLVSGALGGGGGEAPEPAPQERQPAAPEAQGAAPARETDVVVDKPTQDADGAYYLKVGSVAWKGELEDTDNGQQLTLEGPTVAQFKRSITLPDGGSITTGVFGRAEPDKPIVHASFHRVVQGQTEVTTGTYHAVQNGAVLVSGSYSDRRAGETVTRTYSEDADPDANPGVDDVYSVEFEAPVGVPIPALVGWEEPEPAPESSPPPAGEEDAA